jgi:hypothetical protein
MSDVEVYSDAPVSELQQWGRDAELVASVAVKLVQTSFVPQSYSGKPAEATAAILTGQEIGLKPMAALRSIDIIQGVPAMRAIALRALVQSNGHEIWVAESTRTRAVVKGRRKGSDIVETSTWDTDRAREMSLLGKANWKSQPIAMLLARATSECARLIAADVLLGVPYSIEELQDQDAEPTDAPRKAPASRTAKRQPLPAREEPKAEAAAVADAEPKELAAPAEVPAREDAPLGAADGEDDPLSPTPEERAEWGMLPGDLR